MTKSATFLFAASLASVLAFGAFAGDQDKNPGTGVQQKEQNAEKRAAKAEKQAEKKAEKAAAKAEIGKPAPNFTLKTTDGKEWSLSDAAGKIVVLEWVNPECPVCKRVMSDGTVAKTIRECGSDVVYVAINSSAARPSSLEGTAAYLKENKIEIPALIDAEGSVGKLYGARTTPHCYVIDSKGVLRYQGAIDDNEGGKGTMNYVTNAVKQIKANETVSPDSTKPYGCSVKYGK